MSDRTPRTRRLFATLAAASLVTAGLAGSGPSATASSESPAQLSGGDYVVILDEQPAASYDGHLPGYAKTRPDDGSSFQGRSAAVTRYTNLLKDRQNQLLESVGASARYSYTVALNGFATRLTAQQATRLAGTRGVLAVTKDEAREVDTVNTPSFLGLSGTTGVWSGLGGAAAAGSGVVVGVIDSGVWPESASFAGDALTSAPGANPRITSVAGGNPSVAYAKSDGGTFNGLCQSGEQWTADTCNTKVISARFFSAAFLANVAEPDRSPAEVMSARDIDGHGSHTASTAAGNNDVPVTINGTPFGNASGMAPGAKLAIYKACWENRFNAAGCYGSDSVAAINQAVTDGVDVLNFSISGSLTTVVDPVELAFYNAAVAGVFVAASAGNSGPAASTVAHNSPWLMTVAASTHRAFEGTVVLGNGDKYLGASVNATPIASTAVVLSTDAVLTGRDLTQGRLCFPGTLDPARVTGKIVVCDRGSNARTEKSAEVKRAGGVAMVLANVLDQNLASDLHPVPTVHVTHVAGSAIKSYVNRTASPTAAIELGNTTGGNVTPVPQIAPFSSRGPALANGSDLLKPDIAAPGVDVAAAVSPPSNGGGGFQLYSGTSMAAPHIAGLAALLFQKWPTWSPAAVKSAMMTSAYDLKDAQGAAATDPFAQGAGHVDPTRFFTPGLLVLSGAADWGRFLAGQGVQLGKFAPLSATDLNYPSIAVQQLVGTRTVARTLTAQTVGKYRVSVDVPGFSAVHRTSMTFNKVGQQQRLDVTFTRTTQPLGEWAKGFITLTGPTTVRLPVALRPIALSAPAEIAGTGTAGSTSVSVTPGITGSLPVSTAGLAAGEVDRGDIAAGKANERQYHVTIPAGTPLARFDLDAANNAGDFDLYVFRYNAAGTAVEALAGRSATDAPDERVDLTNPPARKYLVVVENYANPPGQTTAAFTLTKYVIAPSATAGALTVSPNPVPVTVGTPASFAVSWSGLTAGVPYLGLLTYGGSPATTVLAVR